MQKSKWFLFSCLFLFFGVVKAQPLSPDAEISILSFGPHTEVYSIWGHTALRVKDPVQGMDRVYNYGTFDFNTPNFTLKFIRGQLNYALSVQQYNRVVRAYLKEKRWIKEQVLNLNNDEKIRLFELLEENYLEENRYYKYDFLFDNCATRPLEMIERSVEDSIGFGKTLPLSYRDILDEHLLRYPWLDLGIDLIIGDLADDQASDRQQMYMPIYVYQYFKNGSRFGDQVRPLVAHEKTISEEGDIRWPKFPALFKPVFVFLFLLLLEVVLLGFSLKKKKPMVKAYDTFWFGLIFLGSLLLLFMWFGTDHVPTENNWNIWWMSPVFLFLLPFFKQNIRTISAKIAFVFLISFLIAWIFIPQQFHTAVLPLVGILGIKSYKYGFMHWED